MRVGLLVSQVPSTEGPQSSALSLVMETTRGNALGQGFLHFPNRKEGLMINKRTRTTKRLSSHVTLCFIREENLSQKLPSPLVLVTYTLGLGYMPILTPITSKEE